MRVVHLKRTFLTRTETFIYSQLVRLQRANTVMLARDLQNMDLFSGPNIRAFCSEPESWSKRWADINYRMLRRMSNCEQQFFRHEVNAFSPDLFHAHYAVDAAYFADLLRQYDKPLIVSCYGYDVSSFPYRYFGMGRSYLRSVWHRADLVLAMSLDMAADLRRLGCPTDKIRIHYYGVDLSRFNHVPRSPASEQVRILFAGSLGDERKGVEYLIRAFARVAAVRPQVELRLVGEGRLRPKFDQLVRTLGLEERVSFAGFVTHDRIPNEMCAAHIFCHPSMTTATGDKEGIPGTIVEAMATGLPIVATRHAGIPEMVLHGEHGFVVAERDTAAISQALLRLIDDPAMRCKLGAAAFEQARRKADAVQQTDELESIYQELLDLVARKSRNS